MAFLICSKRQIAIALFGILVLAVIVFLSLPSGTHKSKSPGYGQDYVNQSQQRIEAARRAMNSQSEQTIPQVANKYGYLPPAQYLQPAQPLSPPRSLPNGKVLAQSPIAGEGVLTIENGTTHDAVVKLVDERVQRAVVEFYVHAGLQASAKRLPDGNFRVIFASGTDWDSERGMFTRDKTFAEFDDGLDFVTTERVRDDGIQEQYSVFTLTLHPW